MDFTHQSRESSESWWIQLSNIFSAELNRDRKLQLDSIFDVQKWEFIGGYQQITEIGGYYNGCFYII